MISRRRPEPTAAALDVLCAKYGFEYDSFHQRDLLDFLKTPGSESAFEKAWDAIDSLNFKWNKVLAITGQKKRSKCNLDTFPLIVDIYIDLIGLPAPTTISAKLAF